MFTKYGQCIRFSEDDVRGTGRTSMGVRGINLSDEDEVVAMQMCSQGEQILIVSANGLGKRTQMEEFTAQNRGGKGVKCYKITEKTGEVVGAKAVSEDDEIMIINTEGIIIRIKVKDTALLGRVTSGVKLINLKDGITGRHFISGDADDLSQKLTWALELPEDERKKISENAQNFVKENFTKQIMCDKTIAVYQELMQK